MKKLVLYTAYIFTMLFIAAGCKKDDSVEKKEESKIVQSAIAGVNGPTSGKVNKTLTFSVVWQNADGTLKFDHLKDSTIATTKIIRLFALTNVTDTLATVKGSNTVSYKFKADSAGTYYLKFYRADNSDKSAIIDTVVIK
ncbi:hypothetical protein [Mucilaginibacter boryungensis]|uniref:DUF4625 domain-containing protein n=1 Tax=Mucilaginibacter boryungensis TaxID=768480 RepID=A0ABR9XJM8_9SPHI|nr:hypothetical protein [Mucilaginibacter boryungensis]MBE9667430.1 hypothetical protein [Mucilaginibacter boryungensis]